MSLPARGAARQRALQDKLGLAVGDGGHFTDPQQGIHIEQPVAGFVDEPMSPVGYIAAEQLSALASAHPVSCSSSHREPPKTR